MLIYDVTYYRGDKCLRDFDRNVSEAYLETLPASFDKGETAFARCLNNPFENREIDRNGVRRI